MTIMMISSLKSMLIISLLFLYTNNVVAEAETPRILPPEILIEALQAGNHIIYMRHGLTIEEDVRPDRALMDLTRCETQRNLSDAGKAQVQQLGMAIKALNIPIGTVKASPYCRTKDSARLVFGEFEVDEDLGFSLAMPGEESERLGQYLLDSMLASDDIEKNTVYVGHTSNLKDGLNVWPKPEGVMVIFKKEGNEIIFKGLIKPDDWPKIE